MKKFLIIIWTLLIIPNAYAGIKDCKWTLNTAENEEYEGILNSLISDKDYSYNNANGKICFIRHNGLLEIAFTLKNGKIAGAMEQVFYHDTNKPDTEIYVNNYHAWVRALDIILSDGNIRNIMSGEDLDNETLDVLKNTKLTINITTYYENGNIFTKQLMKNSNGSMTIYNEDGTKYFYKPIKNYKANGAIRIYNNSGKLYATVEYKDNKVISGKCANKRENGSEWTKEEIYNWEYGGIDIHGIDCGEF